MLNREVKPLDGEQSIEYSSDTAKRFNDFFVSIGTSVKNNFPAVNFHAVFQAVFQGLFSITKLLKLKKNY